MFNKKYCLFLITLVFMLTISAVAATDSNSTDDVLSVDSEEEPPSGSSNLNSTIVSATQQNTYTLSSSDVNTYYKSGDSYSAVLTKNNTPVANAKVSISINGVTYSKTTDKNGEVSLNLSLNAGDYVVSTSYGSVNVKNNIKVLPVVYGSDLVKTYGSSAKYSAKFLKSDGSALTNTNVKFKINGVTYTKKTDSKGYASLAIGLSPGTYKIVAIHPNGYKVSNTVTIKSSITASNLNKYYLSSSQYSVTFYGKDGKPLSKKTVKFKMRGNYYTKTTNSKGVATLKIISEPGTYKIVSINSQTGEKKTKTIKVLPTLKADSVTTFSDKTAAFKVTLYKNSKLANNATVYVYVNGVKKTLKTNSNGVASVNFKLDKGTYYFTSKDPYTGYSIKTKVLVKLASIKASNVNAYANKSSTFEVTLLKQNGKVAANTNMQITLNGVTKTVKTNSKGVASLSFKLGVGNYTVTSKDLSTGYTKTNKITVTKYVPKSYNKYGVSSDGKTILAIGRASASGELSKYGYTFYKTEFLRICPYCGSNELYWGIFWAGSETANYGVFPATGNKEGGSAEGHIFCAKCDCDWSVFGKNHGSAGDLTVVTKTVSSTKAEAYLLKNGSYVS